jgi:signal transduction histidine kinase/CheY-like chemotaxis protein
LPGVPLEHFAEQLVSPSSLLGHRAQRAEVLALAELVDVDKLQRLQDAFASATGVASIITDTRGLPITRASNFSSFCNDVVRGTAKGLANCMRSDAELGKPNLSGPIMRPCLSAGLWDGGASIFAGGFHVANWLIGQVRNEAQREDVLLAYARDIGADEEAFRQALSKVVVMSTERFRQVCEFLFLAANQISQLAYANFRQRADMEALRREEQARRELEQRLRQSQKMEAIGQLAGGVAHDFNNLLTVIRGNAELLRLTFGETLPGSELAMLTEIETAATQATSLTRQLLAFSRKQVTVPAVIDVNRIVDEFRPMLRRILEESTRFEVSLADEPTPVVIDRGQLEQAILNLVVNAQQAMPNGGLLQIELGRADVDELFAASHPELALGQYAVVAVRDTGCGIEKSALDRIFEPFFSTKPVGEGTGLGLSTVYGAAKQAGGHVSVYSEVGHGTTFRLYLPLNATSAASSEQVDEAIRGGSETILLCEDAHAVRILAVRLLREAGYRVIVAETGEQAVSIAEAFEDPIHLLLTDVILPGMDGRRVAERVLALHPTVRVLFVSGYTANILANYGVSDWDALELLEKPYTRASLLSRLRHILDCSPDFGRRTAVGRQ